ncbi:MAG: roadblock/LC7 domain-containing protein, partial [Myxococcota bacterium]
GDQEGPRALERVLRWSKGLFRFYPNKEPAAPPPGVTAASSANESKGHKRPVDPPPVESTTAEESERSEEMAERDTTAIMADMLKVPGIQAVVVIGRDGFVIETSGGSSAVDIAALGASLAAAVNAVEEMGSELSVSVFEDLFIEYGRAVIICRPLGDAVVALVTPDASKLGIIRHKIKNHVADLAKFF